MAYESLVMRPSHVSFVRSGVECGWHAERCDVVGADERVALGDLAVTDAEHVDDLRLIMRAARLPQVADQCRAPVSRGGEGPPVQWPAEELRGRVDTDDGRTRRHRYPHVFGEQRAEILRRPGRGVAAQDLLVLGSEL